MIYDLHPEARLEFAHAAAYCEEQSLGLGHDFVHEVYHGIGRIMIQPGSALALGDGLWRLLLNEFPYGIIYSIEGDRILVAAIVHTRREPDSWKQRHVKKPQAD